MYDTMNRCNLYVVKGEMPSRGASMRLPAGSRIPTISYCKDFFLIKLLALNLASLTCLIISFVPEQHRRIHVGAKAEVSKYVSCILHVIFLLHSPPGKVITSRRHFGPKRITWDGHYTLVIITIHTCIENPRFV